MQLGHLDARAGERALGVARVELGLERHVVDDLLRNPEVGEQRAPHVAQLRQLHEHRQRALGQRVGQPLVDAQRELRRVRGLGEGVQRLADAHRLGVREVEGLAVEARLVGDVVHRRGDEVDRHEVRVAELGPDERDPLRQRAADLLDRLEEVVRAVDLVHLAGLRVPDDDRRAVHAPRHRRLLAHELLGLELRAVVGRRELLALVEVVLAKQAAALAGDGDRRDVVQMAGADRVRERDGVARAPDVQALVDRVVGGHVVHRGEVEDVLDVAGQRGDVVVGQAQPRLGEVAEDGLDAVAGAPALDQAIEALARALADEHVDVAFALQQPLDEVASDESGRARHEVRHAPPLR